MIGYQDLRQTEKMQHWENAETTWVFEIRFRKIVQYFIVLVSFGRAVVLRGMPWQKIEMRAISGLRKNIRCGTIIFLTFMIPKKNVRTRWAGVCGPMTRLYLRVLVSFVQGKIVPGFQTTIHECASVCERILYILCAAFLVFHAKINTLRSGVFCLRGKRPWILNHYSWMCISL